MTRNVGSQSLQEDISGDDVYITRPSKVEKHDAESEQRTNFSSSSSEECFVTPIGGQGANSFVTKSKQTEDECILKGENEQESSFEGNSQELIASAKTQINPSRGDDKITTENRTLHHEASPEIRVTKENSEKDPVIALNENEKHAFDDNRKQNKLLNSANDASSSPDKSEKTEAKNSDLPEELLLKDTNVKEANTLLTENPAAGDVVETIDKDAEEVQDAPSVDGDQFWYWDYEKDTWVLCDDDEDWEVCIILCKFLHNYKYTVLN